MDIDSESNLGESSRPSNLAANNASLRVVLPSPSCALCSRNLLWDSESGDIEGIGVCGDCKFLLLEDFETNSPDVYSRRMHLSRRRFDSSESIESMFSQRFSQMINLARQNQSVPERDGHSVDGDGAARLVRRTSSRTTPSGSRRWRVFSDTESDGFDSVYGESESNASFRRYRAVHGEADTISYSVYGGDSDASIDGQSFLENENFGQLNGESDLDSDTDIDPMNAGLYQWNSDDEEEGDSEWEEEADIEGSTLESLRAGVHSHRSLVSNGGNIYINRRRQSLSPEVEGTIPFRIRARIQAHTSDLLTNFDDSVSQNYVGDFGDYLDERGFGDLLEHLVETESSRRGAPPASESFVKNLPRMTINEGKMDNMACAICKDSFTLGTVVNQLPCLHFYHPSCILPWLSTRNTCPLCRHELPTDDRDYEARKRNEGNANEMFRAHQHDLNDDSSLDATDDALVNEPSQLDNGIEERAVVNADSVRENSTRRNPRSRWFFLAAAAAPIVSVVGISLILWFGNPSADRICRGGRIPYRRENSQRRWWSFF